jgi:hypothetical protein
VGDLGVAGGRGDAEVGQHDAAVVADHDVGRLHVTVDDALPVRGPQRPEQREPDLCRALRRERAVDPDDVGQRARLDELHDEVRRVVVLDHVVDGDGAGVRQLRGRAGLAAGALAQDGALVVGEPVREGDLLDRHLTAQDLVLSAPHGAHAAGTQG